VRATGFIADLAASGRYFFTTAELVAVLGGTATAAQASLGRLKRKRLVATPHRGFHVILPPEYRRLGCLPAEQFIPELMHHLGERYYATLLSAAELHGASHQKPQAFQVMLRANRRPIQCGLVRVQFIARHDLARTPVVTLNTPRGGLAVSSANATALELLGYVDHCGGLDNVVAILEDLVESLTADALVAAARKAPVAWAQRLGYLLDRLGRQDLADPLASLVANEANHVAPLIRSRSRLGAARSQRWRLAINADVELGA
jgi:predicted transcriptional regulator of viral defense system